MVPKYVTKALVKLGHKASTKPEHSPHCHVKIKYGKEGQLVPPPDETPLVMPQTVQYIQTIVGIFLWYARAVDLTLLPALNAIASQQSAPTEATLKETDHLLNYLATYPNATVRFRASNMILHIHSDAAYMVLPEARSRAGGYFYLSNKPATKNLADVPTNGAIHNE